MKILLAGLPLLAALMFQTPPKPPMKMGLWETTATTQMSGVDLPPGMAGLGSRSLKIRACVTPESYDKAFNSSQTKDCVRSNESWSGKTYSFDLTCRSGKTTGHFEMTFDSEESGHSKTHLVVNPDSAHPVTMDTTGSSQFISSDCGAVTPDKPQLAH